MIQIYLELIQNYLELIQDYMERVKSNQVYYSVKVKTAKLDQYGLQNPPPYKSQSFCDNFVNTFPFL